MVAVAETTEFEQELSRAEVAASLRKTANEFEQSDEDGEAAISLSNKQMTITPRSVVTCTGHMTECSGLIGSNTEEFSLSFTWTPGEG